SKQTTPRRGFLGTIATGAAALGLTALASPFTLNAQQKAPAKAAMPKAPMSEADVWFGKVKGTHRIVYDATRTHEVMPFVWPKVFLLTNAATGSPEHDCGVVVILRHEGIPYAFKDEVWEKYNFKDLFNAKDIGPAFQAADASSATKTRNPFWNTKPGDFKVPGFGDVPIGIKDLQASGVMFAVCNAAMTVFSAIAADGMKMKHEDVMKEWKAALIPGVQIVPSGVWAVGRAQEHGCKYCFAG
ncbi:MAG: hypothetical protein ACHQHP_06650, partial [Bacteroidia bacterium]